MPKKRTLIDDPFGAADIAPARDGVLPGDGVPTGDGDASPGTGPKASPKTSGGTKAGGKKVKKTAAKSRKPASAKPKKATAAKKAKKVTSKAAKSTPAKAKKSTTAKARETPAKAKKVPTAKASGAAAGKKKPAPPAPPASKTPAPAREQAEAYFREIPPLPDEADVMAGAVTPPPLPAVTSIPGLDDTPSDDGSLEAALAALRQSAPAAEPADEAGRLVAAIGACEARIEARMDEFEARAQHRLETFDSAADQCAQAEILGFRETIYEADRRAYDRLLPDSLRIATWLPMVSLALIVIPMHLFSAAGWWRFMVLMAVILSSAGISALVGLDRKRRVLEERISARERTSGLPSLAVPPVANVLFILIFAFVGLIAVEVLILVVGRGGA